VKEHLTMRYMAGFACIGAACEEHCCGGWRVGVDRDHYDKLKLLTSKDRGLRREFADAHQLLPASQRRPLHHATMRLKANGNCCMLDPDGLCATQRRFGAAALSNTCSLYPRLFSERPNRLEMAATLSCPEIARRALLPDDALDLIEFDPASRSPGHARVAQTADPRRPYAAYLDDIRSVVYELLSLAEHPIAVRLFFVSYFAGRTAEFFHRDCAHVDEPRLGQEIAAIKSPAQRAELRRWFEARAVQDKFAAKFIVEVLKIRIANDGVTTFSTLVNDALATYDGAAGRRGELPSLEAITPLVALYNARRESLEQRCGRRIDRYVENYAKNYWMKEWYTGSPNLLVHAQDLLVRIAVQRFMLFSLAAIPPESGAAEAIAWLDQEAVRVFYKFSRNIEHQPNFIAKLTRALEAPEMELLAQYVCFLKF
jgi:lysine-N-methylase